MRDPSKKEQIWTIWETLKPADREKAIEILIETLL